MERTSRRRDPITVRHEHFGQVDVRWVGGPGGGGTVDLGPVLAALADIKQLLTEAHLSDIPAALSGLTTAITAMKASVDADVAHLQDLVAQAGATHANDTATIQRLTDEAAAVVASINDATASVASFDADPSFPPAEPPVDPNA